MTLPGLGRRPSHLSQEIAAVEDRSAASDPTATIDLVEDFYREHSPRLVGRLTRATGCRETALDLAQEAFARLLKMGPARLLGIEEPEAYLSRICSNLVRDWGRRRFVAERSSVTAAVITTDAMDQVAALETRDTLRRLERAMLKLKPRTREIFLAHRIEGLSYAEIAARTGLSVKGVEKQMSRAIAMIDRLLDRS